MINVTFLSCGVNKLGTLLPGLGEIWKCLEKGREDVW